MRPAALLALAMVTGAAQAIEEPPRPWIDPAVSAAFEPIAAHCRLIFAQPLRPLQKVVRPQGGGARATYELAGMSHELVMTSHPARPYLGRVLLRYDLVPKVLRVDAQGAGTEHAPRIVETLEFAWQGGRWVFRGVHAVLATGEHDRPGQPVVDLTPAKGRAGHAAAVRACVQRM